jgi:hypothetical protein
MATPRLLPLSVFKQARVEAHAGLTENGSMMATPDGTERFVLAPGPPEVLHQGVRVLPFAVVQDHSAYEAALRPALTAGLRRPCNTYVLNPDGDLAKRASIKERLKKIARFLVPDGSGALIKTRRWGKLTNTVRSARNQYAGQEQEDKILELLVDALVDVLLSRWNDSQGMEQLFESEEEPEDPLPVPAIVNELRTLLGVLAVPSIESIVVSAHDDRRILAFPVDGEIVQVSSPLLLPALLEGPDDVLDEGGPVPDASSAPAPTTEPEPAPAPAQLEPAPAPAPAPEPLSAGQDQGVHRTDVSPPVPPVQAAPAPVHLSIRDSTELSVVLVEMRELSSTGHQMIQNALHRNMLADQMKTCAQQDVFLAQQMITRSRAIFRRISNLKRPVPSHPPPPPTQRARPDHVDPLLEVSDQLLQSINDPSSEPSLEGEAEHLQRLEEYFNSVPSRNPSPLPQRDHGIELPSRDPSVPPTRSLGALEFDAGIARPMIVQPQTLAFGSPYPLRAE